MGSIWPWQAAHVALVRWAASRSFLHVVSPMGGVSTTTLGGGGGMGRHMSLVLTYRPRKVGLVSPALVTADRTLPCERIPTRFVVPYETQAALLPGEGSPYC